MDDIPHDVYSGMAFLIININFGFQIINKGNQSLPIIFDDIVVLYGYGVIIYTIYQSIYDNHHDDISYLKSAPISLITYIYMFVLYLVEYYIILDTALYRFYNLYIFDFVTVFVYLCLIMYDIIKYHMLQTRFISAQTSSSLVSKIMTILHVGIVYLCIINDSRLNKALLNI